MARRDPETNAAAFLGGELRRARVAAGFASQDALSAALGFDRTVIAKAETGERPPTVDVLAAWCQACHLDDDLFGRLAVLARHGDGPVPTWFEDWLQAEGNAQLLRIWQPLIIPGLLQTAEYARALFLASGPTMRRPVTWWRSGWSARRCSTAPTRRTWSLSWERACCTR